MPRSAHLALLFALAAVAAPGCSSCRREGPATSDDLALVPETTSLVVKLSVGRLRDTALWRKLLDLRDRAVAEAKAAAVDGGAPAGEAPPRDYADFVARCAFDPFQHLDSIFLAFPAEGPSGEFGAVVRGTFDEAKLVACARAQAKHEGGELTVGEHGGHKLYTDPTSGRLFITFLDGKTALAGGGEWIKGMLDRATGKGAGPLKSARDNAGLMALVERVRKEDALWVVGQVAEPIRERLRGNERLAAAGSLKSLLGSLDFVAGLALTARFELGAPSDAETLAKQIGEQLTAGKQNPKLMLAGLASLLDRIQIAPEGPVLKADVKLTQAQVDDLLGRLEGLVRTVDPRPLAAPPVALPPGGFQLQNPLAR